MTDETNLEPLHNYWLEQLGTLVKTSSKDFTELEMADAMLTIAVTRMMELTNPQRVAQHLAMISAALYNANVCNVQDVAEAPPMTLN